MLLLIGQVARDTVGREGFQELDYRAMYGPIAKWATQVDDAARLPEIVARAFAVATSGRPGPVVIALPEDMLTDEVDVPDARPHRRRRGGAGRARAGAAGRAARPARERPLIVVGEGGWTARTGADVAAFAEAQRVPVAASFRCQDYVDNASPAYAGHAGLGDGPGARAAHPRGRRAAGDRRPARRDPVRRLHAACAPACPTSGSSTCTPTPDELGARLPARARRSCPGLEAFAAAARGARAGGRRAARRACSRRRARSTSATCARRRELPGRAADVGGDGGAARARSGRTRSSPTAPATSASGRTATTSSAAIPTQLAPRSGSMGYGVPGRGRRQGRAPGPRRSSASPATATS